MRRLLLGGIVFLVLGVPATAADLAPAPMAAEFYDWTGFYLGVTGGWDFDGQLEATPKEFPFAHVRQDDENGGMIGGMAGYRWEVPAWTTPTGMGPVLGVEIAGFGDNISGHRDIQLIGPFTLGTDSTVDTLVTAKGQVGLAFDRGLLYVTGGYAGERVNFDADLKIPGIFKEKVFSDGAWQNGVVVGAGIDLAVAPNWIVGVELDHFRFADLDLSDTISESRMAELKTARSFKVHEVVDNDFSTVLGRIAYHF
jgi:outer membrane immunogenic protein